MNYRTQWTQSAPLVGGYYGASADQWLGGLAADATREFIDDPYVQQTLVEIKEDCKTKAKSRRHRVDAGELALVCRRRGRSDRR